MKRWAMVLTAGLTLAMSAAASAQFGQGQINPTPYNFSFRGGVVLPLDSDLRDVSTTWLSLGVDYTFVRQFIRNSETYLSVDYIAKSGAGQQGTYWPIMVSQRFFLGQEESDNRQWVFGGLGVVVFDINKTATVFGGKVGYGREFSRNIFAEGTLYLSDRAEPGLSAFSLGVHLGYRF